MSLNFRITGDNGNFIQKLKEIEAGVESTSKSVEKSAQDISDSFNDAADKIKAIDSVISVIEGTIEEQKKAVQGLNDAYQTLGEEAGKAFSSGDDGRYRELITQQSELTNEINAEERALREMESALTVANDKRNEYNNELEKSKSKHTESVPLIQKLMGGQEKYNAVIGALPAPLNGAITAMGSMTKAAMAFIATPLGAVVAALVLAWKALSTWFTSSAEGQTAFAKGSAYLSGILGQLKEIVIAAGDALYKMFTDPKKAVSELWEFIKTNLMNRLDGMIETFGALGSIISSTFKGDWDGVAKSAKDFSNAIIKTGTGIDDLIGKTKDWATNLEDAAQKTADIAVRERQLAIDKKKWLVEEAQIDERIAKARLKMYSGSDAEKLKATVEAQNLINQKYEQQIKFAEEALQLKKETNALTTNAQEDYDAEYELEAELIRLRSQRDNEKSMFARRESTMNSKESNSNKKELTEQEKQNEALLALQRKAKQDEIDLMEEGSDKKIAQLKLNYENEIAAIKKLEKEWTVSQNGNLSQDQVSALSIAFSNADERFNKNAESALLDDSATKELINQYQDYSAKRLAIEEKYTKDIQTLESSRTKENESEINRAIAVAKERMKDALQSLDMESFQEEIDWSMVFGDLKRIPTDGLTDLKKKLQDFIATNKDLSPENIKAVTEAIEDISTEQIAREPFENLISSFKSLKDSSIAAREAQEEYNKALAQGTEEEIKNAKAKLDNANANKQKSQSEVINSIQASAENIQEYTQAAKDILDIMDRFGVEAPEWLKESIQGLGEVVSGLESIDITKPMTIITGALQSFKGLATTLLSLGGLIPGAGESDVNLSKDIELLSQSNNDLKIAIDNLAKRMEEGSVADATDTYNQQKELLNASISNTQEMMRRSGGAYDNGVFGIGGSHSSDYKINKAMSSSDWDRISSVVGKTINGASDFWNLTSEEMAKVATEASDLYTKIKDHADDGYQNASQYMDAYIEYYKELNELENQWREKLTSSSFNSIRDDFKSTLLDMKSSASDFADDFQSLMKNAFLESIMSEKYDKKLQEWYKNFASSMEDGSISDTEQSNLKNEWDEIVKQATEERNAMYEAMGWDSSTASSQSSTSKGFQAMSQEKGDELSGRFTALQVAAEDMRSQMIVSVACLSSLVSTQEESNIVLSEIRNLAMLSNGHLEDISKHTKELKEIRAAIEKVRDNTNKL